MKNQILEPKGVKIRQSKVKLDSFKYCSTVCYSIRQIPRAVQINPFWSLIGRCRLSLNGSSVTFIKVQDDQLSPFRIEERYWNERLSLIRLHSSFQSTSKCWNCQNKILKWIKPVTPYLNSTFWRSPNVNSSRVELVLVYLKVLISRSGGERRISGGVERIIY